MVYNREDKQDSNRERTRFEVRDFRARRAPVANDDGGAGISARRRALVRVLHGLRVRLDDLVHEMQDLVLYLPRIYVRLQRAPRTCSLQILNQRVNLVFTKD